MKFNLQQIKRQYDIIGNCEALDRALEIALTVAPTDLTMLILGENGARVFFDAQLGVNGNIIAKFPVP